MTQKNSFFNSSSNNSIMQLMLTFFSFTCITETKDENYAMKYYVNLYSVKNRAQLYNHISATYQIEKKISYEYYLIYCKTIIWSNRDSKSLICNILGSLQREIRNHNIILECMPPYY